MSSEWEEHLRRALLLVRNLRLHVVAQRLDARAVRVALKFALMVDNEIARLHGLTRGEDERLTEIAEKLFKETPKGL